MSGIPEPLMAGVAELRGPAAPDTDCGERERAARALACRPDGETPPGEEDERVRIHRSECAARERMHAAMLEASVCYRGWSRQA
jgi:hypothetical protein